MISTIDYLRVSEQIAKTDRALELHAINLAIGGGSFGTEEVTALRAKVGARFGQMNLEAEQQLRPTGAVHGRFTLLPHSRPSPLQRHSK